MYVGGSGFLKNVEYKFHSMSASMSAYATRDEGSVWQRRK